MVCFRDPPGRLLGRDTGQSAGSEGERSAEEVGHGPRLGGRAYVLMCGLGRPGERPGWPEGTDRLRWIHTGTRPGEKDECVGAAYRACSPRWVGAAGGPWCRHGCSLFPLCAACCNAADATMRPSYASDRGACSGISGRGQHNALKFRRFPDGVPDHGCQGPCAAVESMSENLTCPSLPYSFR